MFGTSIEPSDEFELEIKLGKAGTRPPTLWRGKASLGESAITAHIASDPKAKQIIEQAQKKQIVYKDEFGILRVPVIIGVKWNNEVGESHNAELEICFQEEALPRSSQQQDLTALIHFVERLNESSKQSIEAVAKTAMESITKVADAQAKSLNAVSSSIDALAKSAASMMSIPSEILRDSNEKSVALVQLAADSADERAKPAPNPAPNMFSELKNLVNFVQTFQSVIPGVVGDKASAIGKAGNGSAANGANNGIGALGKIVDNLAAQNSGLPDI